MHLFDRHTVVGISIELQTRSWSGEARGHGGGWLERRRTADRVSREGRSGRVHRELRRADANVYVGRPARTVRALLYAARVAQAVRRVRTSRGVSYVF